MKFNRFMRRPVTRERIETFMVELGRAVKSPGRVYFTGGVSAVLLGWRQTTLDIDLKPLPEPDGFFAALPRLKNDLELNLELASPDDFVPALPGWEDRSQFIATEGRVTYLHFDFYTQALAKIDRLHGRDRVDVRRMFEDGLVKPDRFLEMFAAAEAKLLRYPAIVIPRLARRVAAVAAGNYEPD